MTDKFDLNSNYVIYPDIDCKYDNNDIVTLAEFDIKSAYPTILKLHYSNNDKYKQLIQEVEQETDKLKRNILISTKATELIPQLQKYSKYYLLEIVKQYGLIELIELKKDGGVFLINACLSEDEYHFTFDNKIKYRIKILNSYMRFNSTSFYYYKSNEFVIKGKLKKAPKFIYDNYKKQVIDKLLIEKYTQEYKSFCIITDNKEEIDNLFNCDGTLLINKQFEKFDYRKVSKINPYEYYDMYLDKFYKLL